MLKNLNIGDRFVDEIGRIFIVKEVVTEGYVTEFVEQIDYEEGQKPYKLQEAEPEKEQEAEPEQEAETKKKSGRKTKNKSEEEKKDDEEVEPEQKEDK